VTNAHARRTDIQGLRAVAVLLVIAAHIATYRLTSAPVLGGFIGVDVFFVISGYLITGLMLREVDRTGRVSLADFYARRARRILPAATLVLVAVVAYAAVRLPSVELVQFTRDAWWSSAFLANWHFATVGTDYWDTSALSPLLHFWSLAVEEQFYLVWPLLMLLLAPRLGRRSLAGAIGLVAAASLGWSIFTTSFHGAASAHAAYFSSPARAYELALGALLATLPIRVLSVRVRTILGSSGLVAIAAATVLLREDAAFPGWLALVPTLATVALLASGIGSPTPVGRLLSLRPLRFVGDISYSLYLWHFPVIVLIHASVAVELALIGALATASYYLVEQPFQSRRVPWLSLGRRSLALWPVALAVLLGGASAAHAYAGHRAHLRDVAAERWWANHQQTAATEPTSPLDGIRDELTTAVADARAGAPFPPKLVESTDDWNTEHGCVSKGGHHSCTIGDTASDDVVVLFGDSHVGTWVPAFNTFGEQEHFRVVVFEMLGCAPYDIDQTSSGADFADECASYRTWAISQIAKLHPDTVVLGAHGFGGLESTGQSRTSQWYDGVAHTVRAVRPSTDRVVVLGDVPERSTDPTQCVTDPRHLERDCLDDDSTDDTASNVVTRSAATATGADYVDVVPLVCVDHECPLVVGRTLVYTDGDHLAKETWVLHVARAFRTLLGSLTT